jgi:hypothetical protein
VLKIDASHGTYHGPVVLQLRTVQLDTGSHHVPGRQVVGKHAGGWTGRHSGNKAEENAVLLLAEVG